MNLEGAAASLLEQFPDGVRSELQKQEARLERFGAFAFTGFGIVLAIGVLGLLYWIFDRMVAGSLQLPPGVLLMAFIIFSALALTYVVWQENLKEKRAKLGTSPNPVLPAAATGKLLEPSRSEPVPDSIVDNTTELLVPRPKSSEDITKS